MKRFVIERQVHVTEVTEVEAETAEAALADVATWSDRDGAWDKIYWEYGHAYVTDTEELV